MVVVAQLHAETVGLLDGYARTEQPMLVLNGEHRDGATWIGSSRWLLGRE